MVSCNLSHGCNRYYNMHFEILNPYQVLSSNDIFILFLQSLCYRNILEPFIPQLTELVKQSIDTRTDVLYYPDKQPDRVPQLGWVFFRKVRLIILNDLFLC